MRVVLLTQWYPPEPAVLTAQLAESLQLRGHDVTVVTGFPNYPSGRLYPGYRLRLWRREQIEGVPVVRVPLYPEHSRSGFRRALNYLSFALSALLLGPILVRRPDVLFAYHPPLTVGIPAVGLARLWRVPFVFQIQDLWPETLAATGMLSNRRLLSWTDGFAKGVYRRARTILVISRGFRENLVAKGVPAHKVRVISNWVDEALFAPPVSGGATEDNLNADGRLTLVFAGNIGEAQGLESVIEAAALLRGGPGVRFVIVGDGVALPRLRDMVASLGLDNVRFTGRLPLESMPNVFAAADVLLLHLKDDPLFRVTIPHKTFSYLAAGKPVLAAVAGETADLIRDVGAGITCQPGDPGAIAAAVGRFLAMSSGERREMGRRGVEAIRERYGRERLTGEIEAVLAEAVSGR